MSLDGLDREALVSGVLAVILEDCGPGSLLAMEFAMEAQSLVAISLEGSVG